MVDPRDDTKNRKTCIVVFKMQVSLWFIIAMAILTFQVNTVKIGLILHLDSLDFLMTCTKVLEKQTEIDNMQIVEIIFLHVHKALSRLLLHCSELVMHFNCCCLRTFHVWKNLLLISIWFIRSESVSFDTIVRNNLFPKNRNQ